MKKNRTIFAFFILLLFTGVVSWQCSSMGEALGEDDVIIVFADSLDWQYYEDPLNTVFGEYLKTPIPEHEFILRWEPFENFKNYQNYKNIFFLGRLDSNEPVSQNVKELLNPEIIEGVESGKYFYIPKQNVWAMNQYVLFLVANNRDDMIQKIIDLGDLIYGDFRKFYFKRLQTEMFKRMENKDLEKYIADHFPFTMRVQHDYFIANENLQENYVWIRRLDPDRSILVHWQPKPENFQLTSRWIIDERNRLAEQIYGGDKVVEDETKAYQVKFKQWNAIRLEGTWRNDSLMIGGPFADITFVDPELERIYMLDYYVQAIGRRKKPYLDQLDVIIHTFEVQKEPKMKVESQK